MIFKLKKLKVGKMKWKNPMKQILNKKCRGFEMKKKTSYIQLDMLYSTILTCNVFIFSECWSDSRKLIL